MSSTAAYTCAMCILYVIIWDSRDALWTCAMFYVSQSSRLVSSLLHPKRKQCQVVVTVHRMQTHLTAAEHQQIDDWMLWNGARFRLDCLPDADLLSILQAAARIASTPHTYHSFLSALRLFFHCSFWFAFAQCISLSLSIKQRCIYIYRYVWPRSRPHCSPGLRRHHISANKSGHTYCTCIHHMQFAHIQCIQTHR